MMEEPRTLLQRCQHGAARRRMIAGLCSGRPLTAARCTPAPQPHDETGSLHGSWGTGCGARLQQPSIHSTWLECFILIRLQHRKPNLIFERFQGKLNLLCAAWSQSFRACQVGVWRSQPGSRRRARCQRPRHGGRLLATPPHRWAQKRQRRSLRQTRRSCRRASWRACHSHWTTCWRGCAHWPRWGVLAGTCTSTVPWTVRGSLSALPWVQYGNN